MRSQVKFLLTKYPSDLIVITILIQKLIQGQLQKYTIKRYW